MNILLLGAGGFFGAIARYIISTYGNKTFPYGTLTVNLLGSFLLGIAVAIELSTVYNALFATGFLGAFTTFSTMQIEALKLFDDKKRFKATAYLILTFSAGTLAAVLGYMLVIF